LPTKWENFFDALAYCLVQFGVILALLDMKVFAAIVTGISIPFYAFSKVSK